MPTFDFSEQNFIDYIISTFKLESCFRYEERFYYY